MNKNSVHIFYGEEISSILSCILYLSISFSIISKLMELISELKDFASLQIDAHIPSRTDAGTGFGGALARAPHFHLHYERCPFQN